ncbi:MAG: sigma-54 dependent transcriptional regulator [Syntrophus sp. (in: bacteria)]|nr:sigma-54 dependent transcriptional regulator [Syntrophus sp. (in: bacteria)]
MSRILVIDGDLSALERVRHFLAKEGYETYTASTGTEGLNLCVQKAPELVIMDLALSDVDGLTILEELLEENERIKVIAMMSCPEMESIVRVMKIGAFDYIHKSEDMSELSASVRKVMSTLDLDRRTDRFPRESTLEFRKGDIIGTGKGMREIFKMVGVISQSRTTVLIEGESGTGKELVAKVIHSHTSPNEPFIAVNCSAIVETLLESELFGHEKGSFTSAFNRQLGKFELARYGTLFLDEISEMSVNLQAKLLRVLQEMEFERVGGKDKVHVHARVIAATNKNLRTLVREGKFRPDLFYRLNIVSIKMPPLRERPEDIPRLVQYLLAKVNRDIGRRILGVSDDVMEAFLCHDWPGNVRELENLLVRAGVMAKGRILEKGDFPELFEKTDLSGSEQAFRLEAGGTSRELLTLDDVEEQHIRKILQRERGKNKGELCDILGISRPTLERKLEKYGISFERDGFDRSLEEERLAVEEKAGS